MRKWILAALLVPLPALAEDRPAEFPPGEETCYGRVYDAAHLKGHPRQTVARFFLWNELTEDPLREYEDTPSAEKRAADYEPDAGLNLRLFLERRDGSRATQTLVCGDNGDGDLFCGVECDGGYFSAKLAGKAMTITNNGFTLEGVCESGQGYLEPEPDDRVFRLDRLARADCLAERDRLRPSREEAGPPLRLVLEGDNDACYERTYDAEHLAGAKDQTIAAIWLRKMGDDFAIGIRQRDGKRSEGAVSCTGNTYSWACFNVAKLDTENLRPTKDFFVPSPAATLVRDGEGGLRLVNHLNHLAGLLGVKLGKADDVFRMKRSEAAVCGG